MLQAPESWSKYTTDPSRSFNWKGPAGSEEYVGVAAESLAVISMLTELVIGMLKVKTMTFAISNFVLKIFRFKEISVVQTISFGLRPIH